MHVCPHPYPHVINSPHSGIHLRSQLSSILWCPQNDHGAHRKQASDQSRCDPPQLHGIHVTPGIISVDRNEDLGQCRGRALPHKDPPPQQVAMSREALWDWVWRLRSSVPLSHPSPPPPTPRPLSSSHGPPVPHQRSG